jgi:tripartite-type tricarboxylate transporter receptor subunit TctC
MSTACKTMRRSLASHGAGTCLALLLALGAGSALAQSQWPARPVRLIVPILAGGPLDTIARIVARALGDSLGQTVVVDNRPGADGAIAAQAVASAAPDGYTLFFSNNNAVVGAPLLNPGVGYDPLVDLTPISFVGRMTLVIFANPQLPVSTLSGLVEHARAQPGKLSYATSTTGDVIAAMQLLNAANLSMVRVPYKGAAQAIPDIIAGRVDFGIAPIAGGLAHARDGRLRMLAVILPARSPLAPELPTASESGWPSVSVTTWAALFGPRGLPPDISTRLGNEVARLLSQPDVRAQFDRQGFRPEASTPQGLAERVSEERAVWGRIIRDNGITGQ